MQDLIKIEDIRKTTHLYRHFTTGTANFEDVGSHKSVHQVRYLYWIERARTIYYRDIGVDINQDTFPGEYFHVIVHNTCDFFGCLGFMEEYEILSRADFIKYSSIGMEHLIRNKDGKIIAREFVVLVFLDNKTNSPHQVPQKFRNAIIEFEGENVQKLYSQQL